jgi:ribonuclease HI
VEKAITLHLANQGEINGWWHPGQHGSRAGRNTTDALLWLIRRVRRSHILFLHRGHAGIDGNETADQLAKDAAAPENEEELQIGAHP